MSCFSQPVWHKTSATEPGQTLPIATEFPTLAPFLKMKSANTAEQRHRHFAQTKAERKIGVDC